MKRALQVLSALAAAWTGLPLTIQLLCYAMLADLATGIAAALLSKSVSSDVGRKGVTRKAIILIAVAFAEIAGRALLLVIHTPWGVPMSLGGAVAGYYLVHELISITENMSRAGVPVPPFVRARLAKVREEMDEQ